MVLNAEKIKKGNLIEPFQEDKLGKKKVSYDLSIDKIVDMNGNCWDKNNPYKIQSQEMVWIICKEVFKMPNNVIGLVSLKTQFAREGLFCMNTGIIDPCYTGNISTLLINFGKGEKLIFQDEVILRVTFFEISEQEKTTNENIWNNNCFEKIQNDYLKEIQKSTENFATTFLNIDAVYKSVDKEWWKIFWKKIIVLIPIIISIIATIIALLTYLKK